LRFFGGQKGDNFKGCSCGLKKNGNEGGIENKVGSTSAEVESSGEILKKLYVNTGQRDVGCDVENSGYHLQRGNPNLVSRETDLCNPIFLNLIDNTSAPAQASIIIENWQIGPLTN